MSRDALARGGMYAGGFLGPFGGAVVTVLIPDLRDTLHASTAAVALSLPAYYVPFALLQLVSGTLGERMGLHRTIRTAYVAFALASLAIAAATSLAPFLIGRAALGCANAFTSPLILAALAETASGATLGRTMGTFAAVQTAGQVFAPLCGGLLGTVDPRLAFVAPAIAAAGLVFVPLPPVVQRGQREPPRLRSAFTRSTAWTAAAGLLAFMSITGLAVIVTLRAADAFGVHTTARGILLAGFGLGGVLVGRAAGGAVDRRGRVRVAATGAVASAVLIAPLGAVDSVALLAALWFLAGMTSGVLWAGLNTLAVESNPVNRAGAVSVIGAFKFLGSSLAPLVWIPIYDTQPWVAFATAGLVAAAVAPTVVMAQRARN